MEHRWGARARIDIPVQVDCGSHALALGVLRDASVSGAFLCTAAQLALLTCVRVRLAGAQFSPLHSSIAAHVVRRAEDGFGLEWTQLAPAAVVAMLGDPGVRASVSPRAPSLAQPAQGAHPVRAQLDRSVMDTERSPSPAHESRSVS